MNRFILGHWVVIYFINAIIYKKQKTKASKAAARHLFCQQPAAIITHAKAFGLSTMSILCCYTLLAFLLLNHLRAGVIFTSYSIKLWLLGCVVVT